jgi:hypothetical protein
LRVSRRSRHSHDDCRSSRFPHHTLLPLPPMRLQPPVRPHAVPKIALGGTAPWRPPSPFTQRVHRRAIASAPQAPAGGPEPAGGPGEDQQHDHSGHDARTTMACPSGSSSAPPTAQPRTSRTRYGEASGGCAAASATARSRSEGCGRSSRNGGPLPPFTSARDDLELGALIGAGWSGRKSVPTPLDGSAIRLFAASISTSSPAGTESRHLRKSQRILRQPVGAAKRAGCWIIPTARSTACADRSSRTQGRVTSSATEFSR